MTQCRGVNEEIMVMTNSMIFKAREVGCRSVEDGKKLKIRVPKQHLILCMCLILCISRLVNYLNPITSSSHFSILPQDVSCSI
jgi:hypothetical protein